MEPGEEKSAHSNQEEAPANLTSLQQVFNLPKNENTPVMMLPQQAQQQQLISISGGQDAHAAGLLQAGGGFVNVPIMPQQETADSEVDPSFEEVSGRDKDELREQDRFLPIANVARIMKKAIPESGKIAKDAKECVQECVSEFISFITSEASERCQQEKRKTINGEDILFAVTSLGFENYVEPLKIYLTKYRKSVKGEKVMGVSENINYIPNGLHPSMISTQGYTYRPQQGQVAQLQTDMPFTS